MSGAKEVFLQRLEPRFKAVGFELKKSRNAFVKVENNIEYAFKITFDGRGGLCAILQFMFTIESLDLRKAVRQCNPNKYSETLTVPIYPSLRPQYLDTILCKPNMYNLTPTQLGQLSFEEKYPDAQLNRVVDYVWKGFEIYALPAVQKYNSNRAIYEGIKNYDFAENTKCDCYTYPLVGYLALRFLSKQFKENADIAVAHYFKAYEPSLELNPLDFALIDSVEDTFE